MNVRFASLSALGKQTRTGELIIKNPNIRMYTAESQRAGLGIQ